MTKLVMYTSWHMSPGPEERFKKINLASNFLLRIFKEIMGWRERINNTSSSSPSHVLTSRALTMYQAVFKALPCTDPPVLTTTVGVGFHKGGNEGVSDLTEITLLVDARAS